MATKTEIETAVTEIALATEPQTQARIEALTNAFWRLGWDGDHDDQVRLAEKIGLLVGTFPEAIMFIPKAESLLSEYVGEWS